MESTESLIRTCPRCGAKFSGSALNGLCPACVGRFMGMLDLAGTQDSGSVGASRPGPPLRFFGDYELLEEIARGGMGVVYKARQLSLNRPVAVKMILGGRLASVADVQRFRAEAEAVANLRHSNIVAIHEIGEHDGQHFFSMDYVEGKNLAELVAQDISSFAIVKQKNGGANWFRRAAGWMKTLAEAIQYAHQQGTLHRDLKPSNVLIDAADVPHITDFGLARSIKRDSDLTVSGQVLGTPNFMPPEQASGKRAEIGPHSDVYSLGAMLYFLLTGRPPFAAETVHETLHLVTTSDPAPPRALNPAVPRDLETICLKCLEKEPSRRYATAKDLADDLDRFLGEHPVLARPVTVVGRYWRLCRRHRLVAGLAFAAVVLPIIAVVLARQITARPRSPSESAGDVIPAEMPTNTAAGIAGVIDGRIYVTSGTDGNSDSYPRALYVYDPAKTSWWQLRNYYFDQVGPSGGVVDGKLILAGGNDSHGRPVTSVEAYDPRHDMWMVQHQMPTPRAGGTAIVLSNVLYVLGGFDGTHYLSSVVSYDLRTDRWSPEPSMLSIRQGCCGGVLDGVIYAAGGTTNSAGALTPTIEAWKPGGEWKFMPANHSMPVPVCFAGVVSIGGIIYIAGGEGGKGSVSDLQAYSPNHPGGTFWRPLNSMPEPRHLASTAVLNGEIYVFGGWNNLPSSRQIPCPDVFVYNIDGNRWRKSSPSPPVRR